MLGTWGMVSCISSGHFSISRHGARRRDLFMTGGPSRFRLRRLSCFGLGGFVGQVRRLHLRRRKRTRRPVGDQGED